MRIVLLLSVACMGYAMENEGINRETQPLIPAHEENSLQNVVQHYCDHHGGTLILCGALTCIGTCIGVGCWHAGATKTASAIVQTMQ